MNLVLFVPNSTVEMLSVISFLWPNSITHILRQFTSLLNKNIKTQKNPHAADTVDMLLYYYRKRHPHTLINSTAFLIMLIHISTPYWGWVILQNINLDGFFFFVFVILIDLNF